MKTIFWIIAVLVLFLIQQGILVPFNWVLVNPVLVFLVIFAILGDLKELIILSVVSGLIFDFYSGLPDGIFVLTFVIITFLIQVSLISLLARETNKSIILLAVLFGSVSFILLPYVFNWLIVFLNLSKSASLSNVGKNLVLSGILNIIIIIPIYFYYKLTESLSVKLFHIK